MIYDFEIGVIGGGPAGTTAALKLAGLGFEVCLFEKKNFPRETLCGEFLSNEVTEIIKKSGLFDEFLLLNPNRIKSFTFYNENSEGLSSDFNFPAFALSRSAFDNFLLCKARKAGVKIYQPAEVKEIERTGDGYILKIINNSEDKIKVKFLIAAYGKQNILDKELNRNFINSRSRLNGIKFHLDNSFVNFDKDEIHIYAADNIYCGVNAVDNNKITFCFLENRKETDTPPRKQLSVLADQNKNFRKIIPENFEEIINEQQIYGTGNIYFGKREVVENGIFMIGDSSGVIAPLAGDGIAIALESATLISDLFSEMKSGKIKPEEIEHIYRKEWENLFSTKMRNAMFIQKIILNKNLRKPAAILAKTFPSILRRSIKATRN